MMRRLSILVGLTAVALIGGACATVAQGGGTAARAPWTEAERNGWYFGSQGSRMMPARWFMALEQAGSTGLFADEANLTGFGYIAAPAGRADRLPIGFAVDRQPDDPLAVTRLRWYAGQRGDRAASAEPWVGLNCSACHTAQIAVEGRPVRVDGGPGLGDFDAFVAAMDAALVATRGDAAKWNRFAGRVLGPERRDTPANRAMLATAVDSLIDWQKRTARLNATPLKAGFARVDAFGHIYNKVVLFADAAGAVPNAADAPVSYPFLWNINRQKKVQWNGIAENARVDLGGGRTIEYGALGRNAGEVLGVFGEATVLPAGAPGQRLRGFRSSLNIANLDALEGLVARMPSPVWPAATDPALVAQGRQLYGAHCASCHRTPDMQQAGEPTEVMVPFRQTRPENLTDIWMACNAYSYDSQTGRLKGTRAGFVSGDPLGDRAPVGTMLAATVKGALAARKGDIIAVALGNFAGVRRPPIVFQADEDTAAPVDAKAVRRAICMGRDDALLAYKARPLDGIWATAPYLHNGSVPTLADLLLPADQRPKRFRLGTRAYDLKDVGYARMESGGFLYETVDANGRPIEGNGNAGHDYGAAAMSPAERRALLEFLKTL